MSAGAPFPIALELPGWDLFWAFLEAEPGSAGDGRLAVLRHEVSELARASLEGIDLASHATAAALRKLFRAAGTDPTRYRPASEALLRRVLKGEDLPEIHPLVDINNCLSVELAVPCCVAAEGTFTPPLVLRAGRPGESYESLKGPFNLEGKPLLVDAEGPLDTPITGSVRVKVRPETRRAWLVAYLPEGVVTRERCGEVLAELLAKAGVVRVTT
ncbi:MAG TPA: phenylalanine--tRNA ligase beta subunit-related protein [Thermoanaerobaculia bacterium]|nr:phenylalanine--tRNA ligase beta subunit-related protein [Thermoanaerobaculia bacterium]